MALSELYTIDSPVGGLGPVRVIAGSLASATDHTIYTPPADQHVFLLAERYAEGTAAANPTYKSGNEAIVTPELAANQGDFGKVEQGYILASEKGQPLKVNPAQNVSSVVYHVVVGQTFRF